MKLFTIRGIPVHLHISFLVIAAAFVGWELLTGGLGGAASLALMGTGLFGSVLLHELGHALMARRYDINTRSITLYPFGGIAALEAEPEDPDAELAIALAGPAVNGLLFGLALPLALLGSTGAMIFAAMNLIMGVFNLAPAFPMDGGRVLRAWLSKRRGADSATETALTVSKYFAWGFLGLGLVYSPSLALVGAFLLWAGGMERRRFQALRARRQIVEQIRVRAGLWEHPAY